MPGSLNKFKRPGGSHLHTSALEIVIPKHNIGSKTIKHENIVHDGHFDQKIQFPSPRVPIFVSLKFFGITIMDRRCVPTDI
jgi:hypothetical protein